MRRSYHSNSAFLDLLFNTLLCFAACFAIALVFMNQNKTDTDVKFSAYIMIIATWPAEFNVDVDLYVKDPNDEVVFFRNKSNRVMHLDRDDLGRRDDGADSMDGEIPENREIVTIRRKIDGEFIVNAHVYAKYSEDPLPVSVRVVRISPRRVLMDDMFIFDYTGEERTICRFTVGEKGKIYNISDLPFVMANNILRASPQ